jgi:hypothetical protein
MLGDVVAVDAGGVGVLQEAEAVLVELFERNLGPFYVIENSEPDCVHVPTPPAMLE